MNKLGVIGKPSDWLISCNVDYKEALDKFGILLIDISSDELIDTINNIKVVELPQNLRSIAFNIKEVELAYKIYLALKIIVDKYELEGFTIRCFDLLGTIKSTSCLALALFNDDGIIGTCEGDIPALISMFLVKKLLNKPSFQANPSKIDVENSKMILAHCTLPLTMTTSFKLTTHFESGIGVGIKGELATDNIFIFRINASLDKFVILKGKIINNLNKNNLCRTQIEVTIDNNIEYFLTNPLGNHHLIVYGDDFIKLKEYLLGHNLTCL